MVRQNQHRRKSGFRWGAPVVVRRRPRHRSDDYSRDEPPTGKGQDASPTYTDWGILKRVYRETRWARWAVVLTILIALAATPITLLQPVPLKIAVDTVLSDQPLPSFMQPFVPGWLDSGFRILVLAGVLQIAIALLAQLQSLISQILVAYTGERMTLRFQSKLLSHMQRLSFTFHDQKGTADAIYRIQRDARALRSITLDTFIPLFGSLVTLLSMFYIVFGIDWQLAIAAVAIAPLLVLYSFMFRRKYRPRYKELKEMESSVHNVVQEVLTSARVVKAFGREKHEQKRFVDRSESSVRMRIRLAIVENAFRTLLTLTTATGGAVVLVIGIRNVQADLLTLGELLIVLAYIQRIYPPLLNIGGTVASIQTHMASAQRAFETLDALPEITEKPNARPIDRARGDIDVKQVSFAYEEGRPVLSNVSMRIPSGTSVGVVGPTGAGKTTLVSLVTRFFDPDKGSITLDGVDLRDYRLDDLREQYSIVLQEPLLLSTTIGENIAYARPSAGLDDIEKAARAAGAHKFIVEQPMGYDTVVGERGMRLSGGERQRISLARAFLKDAPILVLDEPTSSVDVATEAQIMEAMARLMEGRTTFMIAHRVSTIEACDWMLEIAPGGAVKITDRSTGRTIGTR